MGLLNALGLGGNKQFNNEWDKFFSNINENEIVTDIGKVDFWDESDDQGKLIRNGSLGLRNSNFIIVFRDSVITNNINDETNSYYIVSKEIIKNSDLYSVFLKTDDQMILAVFVMNLTQANDFIEHFNMLNNKKDEAKNKFRQEIEIKFSELEENMELENIIHGYLQNSPDILLYTNLIIYFEHLLCYNEGYLGRDILASTEEQRNIEKDNAIIDEVQAYKKDYFDKLIKITLKNGYFDTQRIAAFTIWRLMNIKAISYFSQIWQEGYESYFDDMETSPLEDYVNKYVYIDCIDVKLIQNVGLFTYFLMNKGKFDHVEVDSSNFLRCFEYIVPLIIDKADQKELNFFETKLLNNKNKSQFSIDDVDLMNGVEFEKFIAMLFSKMGYSTKVTQETGDQGIDVLAEKNGTKIGIQAKCYSGTVPNAAIQEVAAGIAHYRCDKGIVITNNYFSKSAIKLAESNNVVLWDRDKLKEKISEIF
jgi:HJR/Mrr/RecB family endonuclease